MSDTVRFDLPKWPDYVTPVGPLMQVELPPKGPRWDGSPRVTYQRRAIIDGELWLCQVNPDGDAWMTLRKL